ncbi:MAG: bifunctional hydroxymethylpyrimidine kinase/phosphomethylpyrimidine kinase [Desulfatiglandaceae bacterium]
MEKRYKTALTIAGSDSSGGAGIQADIKTFSALGCYAMSVITALTAQNTTGVRAIHAVPPEFAAEQLEAIFTDIPPDSVKIGMLYSAELIETVARMLTKYLARNIVLDPVMAAQSGDSLLKEEAVEAVKTHLMPMASVVTPNVPEAEILLGSHIMNIAGMEKAARDLAEFGSKSILVKGGHLEGDESTDILFIPSQNRLVHIRGMRLDTRNNHGTGCTLSSAIASFLAHGSPIEEAVFKAKDYLTSAMKAGAAYEIGKGHGPVHHFHRLWKTLGQG